MRFHPENVFGHLFSHSLTSCTCAMFVCSVQRIISKTRTWCAHCFSFRSFYSRSFVASLQMSLICNLRTSTSQFRLFSLKALLRIRIVLSFVYCEYASSLSTKMLRISQIHLFYFIFPLHPKNPFNIEHQSHVK